MTTRQRIHRRGHLRPEVAPSLGTIASVCLMQLVGNGFDHETMGLSTRSLPLEGSTLLSHHRVQMCDATSRERL